MAPSAVDPPNTSGYHKIDENAVTSIWVSDEERLSGIPSAATIGQANSLLHRDGIVVLDNVVSKEHIKVLNDKLYSEIPILIEDPNTNWNGGKGAGNISQPPPFTPELMFSDIWANPFTTAVISSILGPRPHVNYVNGNTSLPNTYGRQQVHADLQFPYSPTPFAMVANYHLCDTDESNGATEVWLRSHQNTHFDMHKAGAAWIKEEHLEAARHSGFHAIRPSVKAGSVVIRDLRLWHAGRSNPSDNARIMLAFVHFPWWYQNELRITLPEKARPFLESVSDRLVYNADFVPHEVDHMKTNFNANFESNNRAYKDTIPRCENVSKGVKEAQGSTIENGANGVVKGAAVQVV